MILSLEELFSDNQDLTVTGAASDNIIDLGAPGTPLGAPIPIEQDIGKGRPIPILVQLDVDSGGTDPTLDVTIEVDNDVAFGSPKVVAVAPQVVGGLAGDRVSLYYVPEETDERYLRLNYVLGGTSPTYTVTAGIVLADSQST